MYYSTYVEKWNSAIQVLRSCSEPEATGACVASSDQQAGKFNVGCVGSAFPYCEKSETSVSIIKPEGWKEMRILIATVSVPFVRGGAETLAEELRQNLLREGHEAEIAAIPFKWYPPERILDNILACRLLDITESCGVPIDRVIGLKFPAYLIPHPNKVMWLLHQHRPAYDLWSHSLGDLDKTPCGEQIRSAICRADERLIPKSKAIYTIAENVAKRLKLFNGIDGEPLYHPPKSAGEFRCQKAEPYLFFPSRLCLTKRQGLVLQALARTEEDVRIRISGTAANPAHEQALKQQALEFGISDRVEWLGHVTEEEKRRQYARAIAVVFPPVDEDYGYVTLEAMLSSKPVITCNDSGGPLEFVEHEQTGLVTSPTPLELAAAFDLAWRERDRMQQYGEAGRRKYDLMDISWSNVIRKLVA
jgi:glycosyltransferase involved in cell wall biosynthesis